MQSELMMWGKRYCDVYFSGKTADTSTRKLSVYVDIFLLPLPRPNIIGSRFPFARGFGVIYELLICIDRYSDRVDGRNRNVCKHQTLRVVCRQCI